MAHFELVEKMAPNAVIKVIGVGGGGGNAVAHMVNGSVDGVEFITANTDAQAIKNCGAKLQLQLGSNVTKGLGAGRESGSRPPGGAGRSRTHHGRAAVARTWCSSPPAWAAAPARARHRSWRSWPRKWASSRSPW